MRRGRRDGTEAGTRRRTVLLIVTALLLVLVVDGLFVIRRLRGSLTDATSGFERARTSLSTGESGAAGAALRAALKASRAPASLTGHPSYLIASSLPWLSDDVEAIEAMGRAARLGAGAGLELVDAADVAGTTSSHPLAFLYSTGKVRFGGIRRAQPHIDEAARMLDVAGSSIADLGEPGLGAVRRPLLTARREIAEASASAAKVGALLDVLPAMFADQGVRRYLLAFESLGEARGTGGLLGHYGILVARGGRLELSHVGSIDELADIPVGLVETPRWHRRQYGPLRWDPWQQANMSPHFPLAARIWLELYERAAGTRLDGVISMDPVSLGYLTGATGPIRAKGLDRRIGPGSAVDVLMNDSYDLPYERQTVYHSAVVRAFWRKMNSGQFDGYRLVDALLRSARTGHFKVFMREDPEQSIMRHLDVDGGSPDPVERAQLVTHNNASGNKVDYFLRQSIATSVILQTSGEALVSTTVTLRNAAPSGPPSYQLGPAIKGDVVGLNRMELAFVLPAGSDPSGLVVEGTKSKGFLDRERESPVVWTMIEIPPGESREVTCDYLMKAGDAAPGQGRLFRFALRPQPSAGNARFSLTVSGSPGMRLEDGHGRELDLPLEWAGLLRQERAMSLHLTSR